MNQSRLGFNGLVSVIESVMKRLCASYCQLTRLTIFESVMKRLSTGYETVMKSLYSIYAFTSTLRYLKVVPIEYEPVL